MNNYKTALLTKEGYTVDGLWRLVPVEPTTEQMMAGTLLNTPYVKGTTNFAANSYRNQIKAAPAPELLDAVPVAWRVKYFDDWHLCSTMTSASIVAHDGKVIEPLFTTPPDQSARIAVLEAAIRNALNNIEYDECIEEFMHGLELALGDK